MKKERVLILFVHGFIGTPYIFAPYRGRLAADGYAVASIILPGHEGSGLEFAKATSDDWANHLQSELDKHIGHYEKIILVSHSMGALLSLCSSVDNPDVIDGLVILSAPIHVKITLNALRNMMNVAFFRSKHNEQIDVLRKNFAIKDNKNYLIPLWVKPLANLNKVIIKTKKILPQVKVPTLLIQSENDEIVNISSLDYLEKNLVNAKKKCLTLQNSEHVYHAEDEKGIIEAEIVAFLDELLEE